MSNETKGVGERTQAAQQPASFKESVILNLRRNQQIMRDQQQSLSEKIVAIDELVTLIEKDTGSVEKFMEIQVKLQGAQQ